ncbi:MAG: hypothetical protein M3P26_15440 [Gemmatimonadota bacterium]|nr:hypothetical protein [Gemmatimonadota bacterium]
MLRRTNDRGQPNSLQITFYVSRLGQRVPAQAYSRAVRSGSRHQHEGELTDHLVNAALV